MICVAISEPNFQKCLQTLDKVEMAEIRIDLTGFDTEEVKKVFSYPVPTVATCRADSPGDEKQLKLLTAAIESGAAYVDIELEAGKKQIDTVGAIAQRNKCKLIVSYHNFQETPGLRELFKIADSSYNYGADVAKIATMIQSQADCARVLSLYSIGKSMVALGMGEAGKITRIMAPFLGAEFTFAAMDDGKATAPGQIKYSELKLLINQVKDIMKNTQ